MRVAVEPASQHLVNVGDLDIHEVALRGGDQAGMATEFGNRLPYQVLAERARAFSVAVASMGEYVGLARGGVATSAAADSATMAAETARATRERWTS